MFTLGNCLLWKLLEKFLNLMFSLNKLSRFEIYKACLSMFAKHCTIYYYLWSLQWGGKKRFMKLLNQSSQLSIVWDENRLEEAILRRLWKHIIPLLLKHSDQLSWNCSVWMLHKHMKPAQVLQLGLLNPAGYFGTRNAVRAQHTC